MKNIVGLLQHFSSKQNYKGTFKYHTTLQGEGRFAQTVRVPLYGGRGFGQIVI